MAITVLSKKCAACGKTIKMIERVAVLFTGVALRLGSELVIDDSQKDSTAETLHQKCYTVNTRR